MNESSEDGRGMREHDARGLRERFAGGAEDKLGKAMSDLLDSPLLSGALGRAFDAREKAAQAQELAMGALNLPSAADIERLTRRLRSVSQRLEGIEDSVQRLDRATGSRLAAIEEQLKSIAGKVDSTASKAASAETASAATASSGAAAEKTAGSKVASAKTTVTKAAPAQDALAKKAAKPRKAAPRRSPAKPKGD